MSRSTLPAVWLSLTALMAPTLASAKSVYLNGVRIDGVTQQKFEKATVRIDEKGDIYIDAPGYAARVVTPPPTVAPASTPPGPPPAAGAPPAAAAPVAEAPPRLTQRYFLVTAQGVPGMAEYDIDVYINSKWIRKLRGSEEQVIQDVTRNLQPGKNTILLTAHKTSAGERKSYSPQHYFKVIIGEGNVGGDNVMIDNPIIQFQRTAADTQDVSEEFTLTTR
ncbi:hypothetical protein [Stigmatella aurantiaca]|uniref:PEGA domain-containing protein n=1 Tax=Stigmatella aurantiaca (strain DW4/3-1) TaxID=378806 RepID=Q08XH0_STIAD|nr:hypothetical protein [Stigmatella aurantiaca]ADO72786.1 uncharacterized protein STAUR_5008 [Stigmatella aurantiaca DW4/3-1]EAU65202.1 hypothetical protein STIAU_1175 [Stigmatella aurantiaca DW4/3-1]